MGYAGNIEPAFIIPTAIADHVDKVLNIITIYNY